jgi:uncharacterized protein involved in exopolysaccharide biosynthesis
MVKNLSIPRSNRGDLDYLFIDIFHFCLSGWKTIVLAVLISVALSIIYLAIGTKHYEATAQIIMAQVGVEDSKYHSFANVEDPSVVILRLNAPSGYSGETIAACGLGGRSGAGAILAKSIKVGLAKGSSNIVEIKITGASPEAAKSCASAIFEQIRATQEQAFEPYKRGLELKIAEDELKLNRVKKDEFKSNSADLNRDASILWAREEIAFLLREISSAKMILRSSKYQLAQLVSPIFTSDESTRPKKTIVLLTGIFGGLFLGLLILLASKLWAAIFKYVEYGDNEMENVES